MELTSCTKHKLNIALDVLLNCRLLVIGKNSFFFLLYDLLLLDSAYCTVYD
jgi:hypothetical protein